MTPLALARQVSAVADEVYCRRTNGKRAALCLREKLVALPLFARSQCFAGSTYQLCPQPGCSMILELSDVVWPTFAPLNEKGTPSSPARTQIR